MIENAINNTENCKLWASITTHGSRLNLIEPLINNLLNKDMWGKYYPCFQGIVLSVAQIDGRTGKKNVKPEWAKNMKTKTKKFIYNDTYKHDWGPIMKFIGPLDIIPEKSNSFILTLDDDKIIPNGRIECLIKRKKKIKRSILCGGGGKFLTKSIFCIKSRYGTNNKNDREVDFFATSYGGVLWERDWMNDSFKKIIKPYIFSNKDFYFSDDLVTSWWFKKKQKIKIIDIKDIIEDEPCPWHKYAQGIHMGAGGKINWVRLHGSTKDDHICTLEAYTNTKKILDKL